MNFGEAVSYLYNLGHEVLTMKLGLETVRKLAAACGAPQKKFPAIHIAGTNGKGSTAAMVESILRAAGSRAGLFTSPHLVSITERIRVDGEEISQDDFARLASLVRVTSEKLAAGGVLEALPTFFEQVTMIAFFYLAEREVEIAVIEVGMGGRLDATNICEPVVTAITPVGFDHEQHLGKSIGEIAGEKAGIIKAGVPVIVAPQDPEAMRVIVARADAVSAPVIPIGESASLFDIGPGLYGFHYQTDQADYDVRLNLRGKHQATNAVTAIHIAEQLKVQSRDIVEGLSGVQWPGRLELIRRSDLPAPLLLDGAHNVAGAIVLRDFLTEHFPSIQITMIFAAMADKSIERMGEILFPIAKRIIVTRVENPRAAEAGMIAEIAMKYCSTVSRTENVEDALVESSRVTPGDGLICACGSLYLVGEVKERI